VVIAGVFNTRQARHLPEDTSESITSRPSMERSRMPGSVSTTWTA
jgi:hypothetical protein